MKATDGVGVDGTSSLKGIIFAGVFLGIGKGGGGISSVSLKTASYRPLSFSQAHFPLYAFYACLYLDRVSANRPQHQPLQRGQRISQGDRWVQDVWMTPKER